MEAMHNGYLYILKSPEWAIASIFLCFQAASSYLKGLIQTGRVINGVFLGVLFLVVMLIIIASTLNAYISLIHLDNTVLKIAIRMLLFLTSSISFFFLVCSSKINNSQNK